MEPIQLTHLFIQQLNSELEMCPLVNERFYNSFDYTRTGQNFCHSRTIGLLAKICWSLPDVVVVDVDVHYNLGRRVRFQPDLAAIGQDGIPLVIVDFESPNSSDARIPDKDIMPYVEWVGIARASPAYLIITSLPHIVRPERPRFRRTLGPKVFPAWEIRYTSVGWANEAHWQFQEEIKRSPFNYWYTWYRQEVLRLLQVYPTAGGLPIYFVNLDGTRAELIDIWHQA
jgi:hypothetical protein